MKINKIQAREDIMHTFLGEPQRNKNYIQVFGPWEWLIPASENLLEKAYPVNQNMTGIMTVQFYFFPTVLSTG